MNGKIKGTNRKMKRPSGMTLQTRGGNEHACLGQISFPGGEGEGQGGRNFGGVG